MKMNFEEVYNEKNSQVCKNNNLWNALLIVKMPILYILIFFEIACFR